MGSEREGEDGDSRRGRHFFRSHRTKPHWRLDALQWREPAALRGGPDESLVSHETSGAGDDSDQHGGARSARAYSVLLAVQHRRGAAAYGKNDFERDLSRKSWH